MHCYVFLSDTFNGSRLTDFNLQQSAWFLDGRTSTFVIHVYRSMHIETGTTIWLTQQCNYGYFCAYFRYYGYTNALFYGLHA